MPAGAHAHAFYREVAKYRSTWILGLNDQPQVVVSPSGARILPIWSSRARVEKVIATVPGYARSVALGGSWENFEENWVNFLQSENILVGVNWSGPNANGYEMPVQALVENVRACIARLPNSAPQSDAKLPPI